MEENGNDQFIERPADTAADPGRCGGSRSRQVVATSRRSILEAAFLIVLICETAFFPPAFFIGELEGVFTYTREWGYFYGAAVLVPAVICLGFAVRDTLKLLLAILQEANELRQGPVHHETGHPALPSQGRD